MIYAVTALDGLAYGLVWFLVAAGLTLIFGVMGVLNLAHGSLYLAGASITFLLSRGSMAGLAFAILAAVVIGAAGGAGLAAAVRPLPSKAPLGHALATLGLSLIFADIYGMVFGGSPLAAKAPDLLAGSISIGRFGYPVYRLIFIGLATLLALALYVLIVRSRFGVMLRATVVDPGMAAATGVNTRVVQVVAMAAGGALAVVGGVLGAPLMGPAPGVDNSVLVLSLIVVVIGGAGSIPGTLMAALLVGQVESLGVIIAPMFSPFALFGVLLAVLALRSRFRPAALEPA